MNSTEEIAHGLSHKSHGALIALLSEKDGGAPVDPEAYRQVWNQAAERIADVYEEGTAVFLESHHPELAREIREARDELDDRWIAEDMSSFRDVVARWRDLHLTTCKLFEDYQARSH